MAPALDVLIASSPDAGMIRFRPVFQVDPFVALTYGDIWAGVVVEREGTPGLVGLGMVSFGELVLRGQRRPYALLHSLVVHPSVRRQGVAGRIIASRLALARDRAGEDAVVVASIQRSNAGIVRGGLALGQPVLGAARCSGHGPAFLAAVGPHLMARQAGR